MAAALLTASPSFAAFTMEELADVTKVGLKAFSTKEPTHSKHSIGFKSWVSGEDAKVKIYVTHDGMSIAAISSGRGWSNLSSSRNAQ